MSLILVGTSHRAAPVDVRERLSLEERDIPHTLDQLRQLPGLLGVSVLSTCNRVEVVASGNDKEEGLITRMVDFLSERSSIDRDEIEKYLYVLQHGEVVRHVFRVAAGLDSMILGEPQIGGQVRAAYQAALAHGALDPLLHKLYEHTFRAAKKARTVSGIGLNAISVPFAGIELARKIFGDLGGLTVLVLGAGKIAELTARHLHDIGVRSVVVANRAFERATSIAQELGGRAVRFETIEEELSSADIVIASTAAPHFVLTREQVERGIASRRRRDLFLIDLSVPRNLDPEIAKVAGAYLYNIDDLKDFAEANQEKRRKKAGVAEEIVEREAGQFLQRLASQQAVPTILELQERLDEIRKTELERCLRRMGPLTTDQQAAIEQLTSGIINKILHYPIVRLKESVVDQQDEGGVKIRDTIRKIFGLR